jgi:hypothetical protein
VPPLPYHRCHLLSLITGALLVAWLTCTAPFGWSAEVHPAWVRVALEGSATTERIVTVTTEPAVRILAITGDCRCVTVTTPLPLTVGLGGRAEVALRISGSQPGLHPLTVHTTAGSAVLTVQVVGDGLGEGAAVLAQAVAQARAAGGMALVVVQDLGNAVRQCGCSSGSLGGIDVLAALPGAWAAAGGGAAQFVLHGAVGVAAEALGARGWAVGDPALSSSLGDLGDPARIVISACLLYTSPSPRDH